MIYTIFRAKNRNGELLFQVQTALKTKQNKTKKPCLYKELPLINDTFDKVQIPDEEIACLQNQSYTSAQLSDKIIKVDWLQGHL